MLKKIIKDLYNKKLNEHEANIVRRVLENEDFIPVVNKKIKSADKIAIICGKIQKYSGGHTSLLRLGTGLSQAGKDITYISFENQNVKEMEEYSKINLETVKGCFSRLQDVDYNDFDVVIATSWQSVFFAKKFEAYKIYFVQDYEPYFFKLSERYLLAKKTYELGFHIVSLGKWNLREIQKNSNLNIQGDYISFPYEPNEYTFKKRDFKQYKEKKELKLAVYAKEDGKRIPNLIQIIIKNAQDELKKCNIELKVSFFGFDKKTKVIVGNNLGKLTKNEMLEVYNNSDFGMVASMTNISLVPYEMMASGLPIFEFKDGSFLDFFENKDAILIDFNYKTFVSKLLEYINEPKLLEETVMNSQKSLKNLSWKQSVDEFILILNKIEECINE